ncbi:uncharacterized protein LOC128955280 [Oppia nitens]|uniref:uncharacterized protein LOC128955280 n=1 Tax=Oppia nitens TaxID=1686743 RepID=UPI0023DC80AB|nr:uncharacterized protein LOC128955280 [Oppia nitens]
MSSATPKIYTLKTLLESPLPVWTRLARDPLKRELKNQLKLINLKPTKRVHLKFDPFHPHVSSIREFLVAVSSPNIIKTNPKCIIKTEIVCQRQEPTITVSLENGKTIIFKTDLLSTLEITKNYNQLVNKLTATPTAATV